MSREKQIESTDWLTRGMSKEQLEREKQESIMSADLALCHTEFETGVGEIYTDYDTTAQKMVAKGYRKSEWISVDERLPKRWETVLIFHNGIVATDFISSSGVWYDHFPERVTHWMPLPEPPKKGGEDNAR